MCFSLEEKTYLLILYLQINNNHNNDYTINKH